MREGKKMKRKLEINSIYVCLKEYDYTESEIIPAIKIEIGYGVGRKYFKIFNANAYNSDIT